ncbi:hypothetical protein [Janthinobacterium lividum]|uniref:hypothetical protein n=1 Tax=Janthinobacterium lividum TaxID=29581 RepID=UPI0014082717|nr:hypothetical protein [Janthinobacterium lividum]NHQ90554.1 hypothetical protein [Janthinobacterium lividum]
MLARIQASAQKPEYAIGLFYQPDHFNPADHRAAGFFSSMRLAVPVMHINTLDLAKKNARWHAVA